MSIGPTTPGSRPHRISLQNPGPAIPDNDGNYTQNWFDLSPPAVDAEILSATAPQAIARVRAGSVLATDTHIVTMPYHPQVEALKTRILFNGRTFNVTGVQNPDESNATTIAVCAEVSR